MGDTFPVEKTGHREEVISLENWWSEKRNDGVTP